jgi:competence ComEA-like helix-hairpin-helix protein
MMSSSDVPVLAGIGMAALLSLGASPGLSDIGRAQRPDAPASRGRVVSGADWDLALTDARAIDVNRADASELERLPGVGPALAARIIEQRQRGRFASPEDLLRVRGIGRKTLDALRERLTFDAL